MGALGRVRAASSIVFGYYRRSHGLVTHGVSTGSPDGRARQRDRALDCYVLVDSGPCRRVIG